MKRVRISNERVNSFGYRVLTSGMDISQYSRNPVLLWMHERGEVIGLVKDLKVENGELTGELVFDEASELSVRCKKQWEFGSLKMVSAGLDVLCVSDAAEDLVTGQTRGTVTKSKLVEVSLVDIGANDDAIVLSKDGVRIALEKFGDSVLPLLNTNPLNEKEMELKKIALALGLAESATEADVENKLKECTLVSTEELSALRKELSTLKEAGIVSLVDGAIAEKKLSSEKKAEFVELGKQIGHAGLKKVLDAMHPMVKLSGVVNGASQVSTTYTKLSEVPESELLRLRAEDPTRYKALYKAEYGMDCEV